MQDKIELIIKNQDFLSWYLVSSIAIIMSSFDRRSFIKTSGAGILPALIPYIAPFPQEQRSNTSITKTVKFFGDGEMLEPGDYLQE